MGNRWEESIPAKSLPCLWEADKTNLLASVVIRDLQEEDLHLKQQLEAREAKTLSSKDLMDSTISVLKASEIFVFPNKLVGQFDIFFNSSYISFHFYKYFFNLFKNIRFRIDKKN